MSALTQERIELRLHGMAAPDGTIDLAVLAPLAAALQMLATRIARDLDGSSGPGRTHATVEGISRLRLGAIADGSTRLQFEAGDDEALPVPLGLETATFDRFWEIVDGLATGHRPAWVTPLIAEAAGEVGAALGPAETVIISGTTDGRKRPTVRVVPGSIRRTVWVMESEPAIRVGVTVTGMLEMVDLRRRQFRIHDDVGNDIVLNEVENAAAANLVGQRVAANADATLGDRGQVTRLRSARIEAVALPEAWLAIGRQDRDEQAHRSLADALAGPGPAVGGIDGVTDEDVQEFLASLRS